MDVGTVVRNARLERGLTQAEVARRAGTSQPAIARLEAQRNSPSVATLERVLAALGFGVGIQPFELDSGVDRTQIAENLRLSPAKRLRKMAAFARGVARLRRAMPHSPDEAAPSGEP